MSTLEREIMEKFHQLRLTEKQRVQALIEQEIAAEVEQADSSAFDYAAWLANVEAMRQQIRATHEGKLPSMDVVGILRDIRDGEDE
jgi:hypothetical protein